MPIASLPAVDIAGLAFSSPLMNGAYIGSKTVQDIDVLVKASCGAVVVGSITLKPREMNKNGGYWRHKAGVYALNSYGMPNGGYAYFKEKLPYIATAAHRAGKPLIVNVAGFNKDEWATLARLASGSGADMLELNLGCPNVWNGGSQKQIASYHPQLVGQIITAIKACRLPIRLCVKISPLPPDTLREVAAVIGDTGCVQAVTATNSYPNASPTTGTGTSSDLLAGLTGRALKPISLGVVKQLRQLLPKEIAIIGAGGISSYNDVADYMQAGATAVQIATALLDEGPSVFDKIRFQSRQS